MRGEGGGWSSPASPCVHDPVKFIGTPLLFSPLVHGPSTSAAYVTYAVEPGFARAPRLQSDAGEGAAAGAPTSDALKHGVHTGGGTTPSPTCQI